MWYRSVDEKFFIITTLTCSSVLDIRVATEISKINPDFLNKKSPDNQSYIRRLKYILLICDCFVGYLQLHIVHFNTKYGSYDEAVSREDGLAIFVFLFRVSLRRVCRHLYRNCVTAY